MQEPSFFEAWQKGSCTLLLVLWDSFWQFRLLSPGQTDSHVIVISHELDVRGDLRRDKNTCAMTSTCKSQKTHINAKISCISLANNRLINNFPVHWLGLGVQSLKSLRWLAYKFDLDQSERKSSQVNARARNVYRGRKSTQVEHFASTFDSVWPGL